MADESIRELSPADRESALAVINTAARWYREFLPAGEYHDPEMTSDAYDEEGRRATWFGAFVSGQLVAVMALEYVKDVALLRHGYVLPDWQRGGIGTRLLRHLEACIRRVDRIVVGTYAGNYKARQLLERSGYRVSEQPEVVLRTYYAIPEGRLLSSVTYEKRRAGGGAVQGLGPQGAGREPQPDTPAASSLE